MCKKILRKIALSVIIVVSVSTLRAANFDGSYNSSLFSEEYSDFKRNTLITGQILYQDQPSSEFTEGFRAEKSETIEGVYTRKVYDYVAGYGSLSLFKSVKEELISEGFDLSFECEGKSCGPVEGWRLLFSKDIAGTDQSQLYVVARLGNSIAAKAVYITEFDSQTRMIIDTIQYVKPSRSTNVDIGKFNDIYKVWQNTDSLKIIGSVFYPTNSKRINNLNQVTGLVDAINTNRKSKFLLVGFSDPRGSNVVNKSLSLQRAISLKNILVSQHAVASDNLVVYGAGELNESDKSFANSRRVTVYQIKE